MSENKERDTVAITVPLDPAHRRMDLALRDQGVKLEEAVAEEVTPDVEQTIYAVLQHHKYNE